MPSMEGLKAKPQILGGWSVWRQRTDKVANAIQTADSIIKTIMDPVEEDELKDLLEDLKTENFAQDGAVNNFEGTELGKRPRN